LRLRELVEARLVEPLLEPRLLAAGLRFGLVLRDRVLEPPLPPLRDVVAVRDEDVLLLRDPGGEDVRVAMAPPYAAVTPVTGTTGVRVLASAPW
jgi:hypothetical protein